MNFVLITLSLLSFFSALRIILGPSIWDRLLGLNLITSKTIMIIIIIAMLRKQNFLLDIALTFALLSFIGIIFISVYIQRKSRY
ncbi:MAG: monovalent cation/H+ antiporter complex subunit F [Proteocatella sp.]